MTTAKRFQISTFFESSVGRSLSMTLLVFTLAPVLALVALGMYTIRVELEKRSVAQIETVADLIKQASGRWITAASDQLAATTANPVTTQNASFVLRPNVDASRAEQVLSKEFAALLATHAFSTIYLVRPGGSIVVSTDA